MMDYKSVENMVSVMSDMLDMVPPTISFNHRCFLNEFNGYAFKDRHEIFINPKTFYPPRELVAHELTHLKNPTLQHGAEFYDRVEALMDRYDRQQIR